jgi:hypothetical protein
MPQPPPIVPLALQFDAVMHTDGSVDVTHVTVVDSVDP